MSIPDARLDELIENLETLGAGPAFPYDLWNRTHAALLELKSLRSSPLPEEVEKVMADVRDIATRYGINIERDGSFAFDCDGPEAGNAAFDSLECLLGEAAPLIERLSRRVAELESECNSWREQSQPGH